MECFFVPLLENESSCETLHRKVTLIYMKMNLYAKVMNGFALVLIQMQKATRKLPTE